MRRIISLVVVAAFVVTMLGVGVSLDMGQNSQNPIPTGGQGTTTITLTNGVINHPPGCNDPKTNVSAGLSLLVETTANPHVGSQICIHVVLTNLYPQPLLVYQDLLAANVTDSTGRVVYHIDWGITPPPNDLNYSLAQGQFWERGVYWDTSESTIPIVAGNYHLTAMLLAPSSSNMSVYKPAVPITSTVDVSVQE